MVYSAEFNMLEEDKSVVLIGTYKGNQLEKWPNYYNYPISDADKITEADAKCICELWLFKGTTAQKTFSATFVGIKTREELITNYAYPAKGKAHSDKYLLFKIESIDYPLTEDKKVLLRIRDFAASKKVQAQLKAYLESDKREASDITSKLPEIINTIPKENLCVCENAFQLSFWDLPEFVNLNSSVQSSVSKKLRSIDLFAGIGGIRLGFDQAFDNAIETVFISEWDDYAQKA
jgi:hypothetical protein